MRKVRAMIVYDGVAKVVGPKKEAGLTHLDSLAVDFKKSAKIKENH